MKTKCRVCGKIIKDGDLNCSIHSYVRDSMIGLAQDIDKLDTYITSVEVKMLAKRHKCCISTVYNHLKRHGFNSLRGWKNERRKNK